MNSEYCQNLTKITSTALNISELSHPRVSYGILSLLNDIAGQILSDSLHHSLQITASLEVHVQPGEEFLLANHRAEFLLTEIVEVHISCDKDT